MHFHCCAELVIMSLVPFLLLSAFSHTSASALSPTQSLYHNGIPLLPHTSSLPLLELANIASANGDGYRRHCATPANWNSPDIDLKDCSSAVEYFYFVEMTTKESTRSREFMTPGARKTMKSKGERTPRKYTFGKTSFSWKFHSTKMIIATDVYHRNMYCRDSNDGRYNQPLQSIGSARCERHWSDLSYR